MFLAIPTPPIIWSAPVVALMDSIELLIITFPPWYVFPCTANPPFDTFRAPVDNEDDSVESVIVIGLVADK